jgi:hypothetical protein
MAGAQWAVWDGHILGLNYQHGDPQRDEQYLLMHSFVDHMRMLMVMTVYHWVPSSLDGAED